MSFLDEYKAELATAPKMIKQRILDLLWSGLSVGEICTRLELEVLFVSGVICENIEQGSVLRREAK